MHYVVEIATTPNSVQHVIRDSFVRAVYFGFFGMITYNLITYSPSRAIRLIGSTDLHYISFHPDTCLNCKVTDIRLLHHTVYLFTSQLLPILLRLPTEGWPG